MKQRSKTIAATFFSFLVIVCVTPRAASSQIVHRPVYPFEFMSWGNSPTEIQRLLGIRWFPRSTTPTRSNMGSGRDDIFPMQASISHDGVSMMVRFEFANSDSGLLAITMVCGNGPGLPQLPDDYLDAVWERNLVRFGETDGGKWIPLIGESKEWNLPGVFIKMIHLSVPTEGLIVKYVRVEEDSGSDR